MLAPPVWKRRRNIFHDLRQTYRRRRLNVSNVFFKLRFEKIPAIAVWANDLNKIVHHTMEIIDCMYGHDLVNDQCKNQIRVEMQNL